MDVTIILQLVEEGLTHKQICSKLGISIGQLNYRLTKHRRMTASGTSLEEDRVPIFEDNDVIGERLGLDRMIALPRDHGCLYVYWELTDWRKRMAEEHFHCGWRELPKYLNVHDVTGIHFNGDHAHRSWMTAVHPEANNWFLEGVSPDCDYVVDYGTLTLDGRFMTLLRSNAARIPPKDAYSGHKQASSGTVAGVIEADTGKQWEKQFTGYSLTHS